MYFVHAALEPFYADGHRLYPLCIGMILHIARLVFLAEDLALILLMLPISSDPFRAAPGFWDTDYL